MGDSSGMWTALIKAHHKSGTDAQIVNCMDRALETRLESSVISFVSNLQARRHELAAIRLGLSVANAAVGAVPIHLEDIIMQAVIFRGLGREFDFTSERLKSTPRLTWDPAEKGILQKDEQLRYERQRKGLRVNAAASEDESTGYQVAAAAAKFNGKPTCSKCGKIGHSEVQCFNTHPELRESHLAAKNARAATAGAARYASEELERELLRRHEEVFGGGAYSAVIEGDGENNSLMIGPERFCLTCLIGTRTILGSCGRRLQYTISRRLF